MEGPNVNQELEKTEEKQSPHRMEILEITQPSLLDPSVRDPAPTVTQHSESSMHMEEKKEDSPKKEEVEKGDNQEEKDLDLPRLIDSDEEEGSEDESEDKYSQSLTSKSTEGSKTTTSSRTEAFDANHEREKAEETKSPHRMEYQQRP